MSDPERPIPPPPAGARSAPLPAGQPPPAPGGRASGPRVILPDAQLQDQIQRFEGSPPPASRRRPLYGAMLSLLFALLGAALWYVITRLTGYELGIIAIVVGVLAGLGARMGGPGPAAQWTGAICAAIGYFAGQMALIFAFALTQMPQLENAAALVQSQPAEQASAAAADEPPESVDGSGAEGGSASAPTSQAAPEKPMPTLAEALGTLGMLLGLLFVASVQMTFTSLGVLFLGIAVYEGYRIPRAG